MITCCIEGCQQKVKSRGLCSRHYERDRLGKLLVVDKEPRIKGTGGINTGGYVIRTFGNGEREFEHRMVAAVAIGRLLKEGEEVHHVDENPANNSNNNLVICDRAYHKLLHKRANAFRACDHYNWLKCWVCQEYDDPSNMQVSPDGIRGIHRKCNSSYTRAKRTINNHNAK